MAERGGQDRPGTQGDSALIRPFTLSDVDTIYAIVNDAATAHKGVIQPDFWHDPPTNSAITLPQFQSTFSRRSS